MNGDTGDLEGYDNPTPLMIGAIRERQYDKQSVEQQHPSLHDRHSQAVSAPSLCRPGRDIPKLSDVLGGRDQFMTVGPQLPECGQDRPLMSRRAVKGAQEHAGIDEKLHR